MRLEIGIRQPLFENLKNSSFEFEEIDQIHSKGKTNNMTMKHDLLEDMNTWIYD